MAVETVASLGRRHGFPAKQRICGARIHHDEQDRRPRAPRSAETVTIRVRGAAKNCGADDALREQNANLAAGIVLLVNIGSHELSVAQDNPGFADDGECTGSFCSPYSFASTWPWKADRIAAAIELPRKEGGRWRRQYSYTMPVATAEG